MNKNSVGGFTLIECMIASVIAVVCFLGTIYLLMFARMHNEIEQERARAHQIVCQALELELYKLFTWTKSQSQKTIWDNGTPSNPNDDTIGTLEVIIKNPKTGAILTSAPNPAVLLEIEATLSWTYRGARLSKTMLRETVMTYKVP